MSKKTFQSAPTPKSPEPADIDQFIEGGPGRDGISGNAAIRESANTDSRKTASKGSVRFTIDVPRDLHRRYKAACSLRGVNMADEIRAFIEDAVSRTQDSP